MRETTAEIWIGPDQTGDFYSTGGGLNATWLILLRENSRPAWILCSGNFQDSEPSKFKDRYSWVPSRNRIVEDALVLFATCGARDPDVLSVFREYVEIDSVESLDIDSLFPDGFPEPIYAATRRLLEGWHVVASVGEYSVAAQDVESLKLYEKLTAEIRTTSFRKKAIVNNGH